MVTETPRQEGEKSSLEAINTKIAEAAAAGDYETVATLVQEAKNMQAEGEKMTEDHFSKEDDALSGEIYQRQAEEARVQAEAQRNADLAKAQEILKEIHSEHGVLGVESSKNELDQNALDLLAQMPRNGLDVGTYLMYKIPDELKANKEFMLQVAEVSPSSALRHASADLQHDKNFIIELIEKSSETKSIDFFQRVSFYTLEEISPEFLNDKDIALAMIRGGDGGSMRVEMLNDPDVFEIVCTEGVKSMVNQAKDRKTNGYITFPSFKLRDDGKTVGGERWYLSNKQEFVKAVVAELSKLGKVREDSQERMIESGSLYFEPNN